MSPMYISGYTADKISTLTVGYQLTFAKIKTCTTKELFKDMVYQEFGNIIESDNFDLYDFTYDENLGVCMRCGDDSNQVPLFTTKSIAVPKKITIGYYYNDVNNTMCYFSLRSTTDTYQNTQLFSLIDGHYTQGTAQYTGYTQTFIDNANKQLSYKGGVHDETQVLNIPSDVPHCISDTDTSCVLSLYNYRTRTSGQYSCYYVYLKELTIEF